MVGPLASRQMRATSGRLRNATGASMSARNASPTSM